MPEPASKVPRPPDTPVVAETWTRYWADVQGHPAKGTVSLVRHGVPAMTVTADLVDGWLRLGLQRGVYRMVASLQSLTGERWYDTDTVTVV